MAFDKTNFAALHHTGLVNVFAYNSVPANDNNAAISGLDFFNAANGLMPSAETPSLRTGDIIFVRTTDRSMCGREMTLANGANTLIGALYIPVDA